MAFFACLVLRQRSGKVRHKLQHFSETDIGFKEPNLAFDYIWCLLCCIQTYAIHCPPSFFWFVREEYNLCCGTCGGCCFALLCPCWLRRKATRWSGIDENVCGTCCASICCTYCSMMQIYNESVAQGISEEACCWEWLGVRV